MRAVDLADGPAHAARSRGPSVSVERLDRESGPSLELLVGRPPATGGGAPVLFVHGACMGAWCWSEAWLPAVDGIGRFAAAVSLRGHGGSEGRDRVGWIGLAELSADLRLAIRAMPSPPVVVAHSLGGLLAQHLLGDVATGRLDIHALVLAGSLPPEGLALIGPSLGLRAWGATCTGLADWRSAGLSAMFGEAIDSDARAAYAARMGESALAALAQACLPSPVVPAAAIGVPAMVLHGRDDRLVDPADAWRSALYHGAAYELVDRAGHCPMLGPQAGKGADALCGWLARVG